MEPASKGPSARRLCVFLLGLFLAALPVLVLADHDEPEKTAIKGRQPFGEAALDSGGVVDATGSGEARPKWNFTNSKFDQNSKDLGRETGIDKIEARSDASQSPAQSGPNLWDKLASALPAMFGGALLGGAMAWMLGGIGIGAFAGPGGLLLGAGIGLVAGFLAKILQ